MLNFKEYLEVRMPFNVRMDQLEDKGFTDVNVLTRILVRYIKEAIRKLAMLLPEMRLFSHNVQYNHDYDYSMVDRMADTVINIQEMIKDMDWWAQKIPGFKSACELARHVPRLMDWVGGSSLKYRIDFWTRLMNQYDNPESKELYGRVITIVKRLESNMNQVLDRLKNYCGNLK